MLIFILTFSRFMPMAAALEHHTDEPEEREIRALERVLETLCADTTLLTDDLRSEAACPSRETELQLLAFEERLAQAATCLGHAGHEAREFRAARLESLIEALECSRRYFSSYKADNRELADEATHAAL
jgi:hypothetical protein